MEAVTFDVTFFNSTSKAIRAFDGTIKFVDLLGNEIIAARVEINEEVPALGQLTWSGGLDYNKYMNPHQRMRSEPIESLRVLFAPGKVLYSDGKLVKFEE